VTEVVPVDRTSAALKRVDRANHPRIFRTYPIREQPGRGRLVKRAL